MASFIANVGDRGFHRVGLFVDCELLEGDVAAKNRPNWYRLSKREQKCGRLQMCQTKMWSVAILRGLFNFIAPFLWLLIMAHPIVIYFERSHKSRLDFWCWSIMHDAPDGTSRT